MFRFRLLKVFDIIRYGMGHIHTISTKTRKQRNTYFYKTILPKLENLLKLSSCYLCSLREPNEFACMTLYEGINMANNHSLPDLLFSSETTAVDDAIKIPV